jgi:hypothetical protein
VAAPEFFSEQPLEISSESLFSLLYQCRPYMTLEPGRVR